MKKKDNFWFWIFIAPCVIAFILVILIPAILGIYYSFTDWNGIQINKLVGINNYIAALTDRTFFDAFVFTAKFVVVAVILINTIGFLLAILVTQKLKGSNALRTIFFMPNLIGGLILGFIWNFIYTNIFEYVGSTFKFPALQGWLATTVTGFWGMIILTIWQMAGYIMIIYIASIQNIPEETLEAAKVDGANFFQRVGHIIFPLVAPAFTTSLFLTLSNSFKLFDQNLSLTNGGPFRSTEMLALNIYKTAFGFSKYGEAQAKAVIFFLVVAAITVTQVYFTRKREVEM